MKRLDKKALTLIVTFCFTLYSVIGCSSSVRSTEHLDKYDDLPYVNFTTVDVPRDIAYRAAILSLQHQGYVVTLSDPQTGLINCEINGASVIPEEQKAGQATTTQESSFGSVLLVILSIILIFGIVLLLVGSSDDPSGDNAEQGTAGVQGGSSEPSKTTSYRYVVTLHTTSVTDSSTEVQVSATRMVLENGAIVHSAAFENKYLNYSVFDAIYDQLESQATPKETP
jgi:hypothetical protein